jgi:uncharacterized membrane protein YvbJ
MEDKMTVYCSKCGAPNEGGSQFCNKCGAQLEQTTPPIASAQTNEDVQVTKRKSGHATASLILGLIGIIINPCLIFAIVFGVIALNKRKKDPNLEGRGQALAGLWIGIIGLVLWILAIFWLF